MKLHSATLDPDAGQETIGVLQAAEEYVPLLCRLNELAPGFPRWILTAVFGAPTTATDSTCSSGN